MNPAIDHRPAVLAIFVLTYLGLAMGKVPGLKINRVGIALLGAIAIMIASGSTPKDAAASVNWPTIFLLFGFFVISAQLRLSGFFGWVADWISKRLDAPKRFLAFLILATAALSAVLNHDIVCYVLAPVVGAALVRKNMDPVPFLVALAIASNIGAAATLIGSPQNILIGEVAGLGFASYMLWSLIPVLFGLSVIYFIIPLHARPIPPGIAAAEIQPESEAYPFNRFHVIKGLAILAVVIGLFFTALPKEVVVLVAAGIHLASAKFKTEDMLGLVDWPILVLFTSLFVVSGAFQTTGYGEQSVAWLQGRGFNPSQPANLAALTAGLSALINNAPAVMLLLKIVPITHASTAYIMAVANSVGGSLIMTASVANIIVVQQARQTGIAISFRAFARLGIPITLISLVGLIAWAHFMGP
jgi:Na+/H+ antiporter NhaD/arsenite permease-like protein